MVWEGKSDRANALASSPSLSLSVSTLFMVFLADRAEGLVTDFTGAVAAVTAATATTTVEEEEEEAEASL